MGDVESIVGESNDAHTGSVEVVFEEVIPAKEGEKTYNINLVGSNNSLINRLNSADLTFAFSQIEGKVGYEIIASNSEVTINPVNNSNVRYEFHYNGKDNADTDTDRIITIGQVKFTGYGKFDFAVDANANGTNKVNATTLYNNIVETFIPNSEEGVQLGELVVDTGVIGETAIAVPVRDLAIEIDFNNAVANQKKAYQAMKVVISGGDLAENIEIKLGTDWAATGLEIAGKADAAVDVAYANNAYTVAVTDALTLNRAYTVTVSGAGYRTARYTVTMTKDKELSFWNNVMDNNTAVEEGEFETTKTFLAGDIVKDNNINIYDLSAVVSYFGTDGINTQDVSDYAKYDLDRNGVIDSRDVAYVLVSWGE